MSNEIEVQSNEIAVVKTVEEQKFEMIQRKARMLSTSELIPKQFQGKIADCAIALDMAERTKSNPLAVLQNLHVIHGKPSWSSQFIIAVVNQCGRFEPLRFHIEGEGDDYGCVAYTYYAGDEKTKENAIKSPRVSIAMAKAEGWYGKSGSKWKTMPELMVQYRAATLFGRLFCPDLLMGMQSVDELADIKKQNANIILPGEV
tara:strand:- start:435 stop:1040 length:606 start_codon:yes stop_codon:yes gene_type:complete